MTKREWKNVLRVQILNQTCYCYLCQKPILKEKELSLDHQQPLSRGGLNEASNWRATHKKCNSEKGALTYEEYVLWQELQKKRYGHIR